MEYISMSSKTILIANLISIKILKVRNFNNDFSIPKYDVFQFVSCVFQLKLCILYKKVGFNNRMKIIYIQNSKIYIIGSIFI